MNIHPIKTLWFFLFLLFILSLASFVTGSSPIGIEDFMSYVLRQKLDPSISYIFSDIRIPRTMALISIGFALGLSGVLLQTVLDNPLAEPYTLGLSGGAALGAVSFIFLNLGVSLLPIGSFLGCILVTIFILSLSKQQRLFQTKSLILTGVMISLFCGSIVTLLISLLNPTQIQLAVYWMMGQVGSSRDLLWPYLLGLFLICYFALSFQASRLDKILLGEDIATSLGVKTSRLKLIIILAVCLLTSLSVSIAGLIGFIGLVAPHLSSLLLRSRRHHFNLTLSPLIGALLFLVSDLIARSVSRDIELPSGSIMALIGAPLLIYLLIKRPRHAFS